MHGEVCMGAFIIWLVVMVPVSALLTGLGMYHLPRSYKNNWEKLEHA